ncbi:MAG: tyrosine-type recombinase/integrase [Halorhabdus sp.]
MGKNRQKYSREDALEVRTFLRLFLGALAIEDEQQRIRTVLIVLCAGRLGLRANEIQHLHEDWIDWKQGIIRVPAHDPCFCKWCFDAAVGKVATEKEIPKSEVSRDDPAVLEYVYENQYEPKPNASARVVPFGWSKRITAWLLRFFQENEFVDVTQEQMRNDTRKAARLAEGVDPSDLTPHPLRATGATFYADAGLLSKPLRDLMGWSDRTEARRYVRGSGRQLTSEVYELFGRGEWAPEAIPEDPDEKFPVACDPRPFTAEIDVDPSEGNPEARRERAEELADQEEPVYNPRRERRPDDIPYDPDEHDLPGHIDPDGSGLQDPDVERDPTATEIRDYIGYQNEQAEPAGGDAERRSGLYDFDEDEEATAPTVATVKVAYVACLVMVSWSMTFGTMG